jgi:hypothetical protein
MIDLDRVQAYCDMATKGPWKYAEAFGDIWSEADSFENRFLVCCGLWPNDGPLFANIRTDLPVMLDELRRARDLLAGLHKETTSFESFDTDGVSEGWFYHSLFHKRTHDKIGAFLKEQS